jgi:hypothetical protein
MRAKGGDATDDDPGPPLSTLRDAGDLGSRHGQQVGQLLCGHRNVNILSQPLDRDLHVFSTTRMLRGIETTARRRFAAPSYTGR